MRTKIRMRQLACCRRSHIASTLLGFILLGAAIGYFHIRTNDSMIEKLLHSFKADKKELQKYFSKKESDSEKHFFTNVTTVYEQKIKSFPEVKPYEWCSNESSQFPYNSTYVEDILKYNISFIPKGYKNPCFYDVCKTVGPVSVRSLRCLPYFHLIGVDKSGSTDLFARITQHPQILPNLGVLNKETSWWPWTRYGHGLKRLVRKEPFDKYLGYFDSAAGHIQRTIQVNKNRSNLDTGDLHLLITGDGTPMDFWDFSGWPQIPQNRNQTIPKILTPHLIKHVNPNVKLILVLRDPTERLYSDYLFLKSGVQTPEAFDKAVLQSLIYFRNCTRRHNVRKCLFDRELHTSVRTRIHVSIYSVFLKEWLKVFPRKQILIIRSEDYSYNISSYLKRIFHFLGVVELSERDITIISKRARAYETGKKKKIGPMLNSTRVRLDNFFQPFNKELVTILEDKKYLWRDTKEKMRKYLEKLEKKRLEEIRNETNSTDHISKSRTLSLTKEQELELKPFMNTDDRTGSKKKNNSELSKW
ncbi:carbohydrate sulfotransferase 15-like [Pecten maximus]|uniref:carbohydrate sulfotransferase 15-like n=1 Tax=Pecten maximus TaxID=6579 RepID=UPI0014583541|nr:carbohydrate sulfotransferase 15-like [Pecten maximus]